MTPISRHPLAALVAACFVCALVAAPAGAAERHLWATVNICDTVRFPDRMGVRASMPGNGTGQQMYMRFKAQYYDRVRRQWLDVRRNGRSDWLLAGSARFESRQKGYTFAFRAPPLGKSFIVRGVVDFQWRARQRRDGVVRTVVVRRERQVTRRGIRGAYGADPPGYSASTCQIRSVG